MKVVEEQKHFLALMARPGDYAFIDISRLDISENYHPNNLMELDGFTMYFSSEEIISSISRANLVDGKYLNGKLVIQDNQKHNPLPLIDKNFYNDFRIDLFLKSKMGNKDEINTIINKFMAIVKDESVTNKFKNALKSYNIDEAIDIVFNIDYLMQRRFIVYLIEYRDKERELEKEKELVRDREKAA